MPDTNAVSQHRQPLLLVVVGRQRVGKTTVVNTIVQKAREAGGQLQVWKADNNETSYNLGMFHDDGMSLSSTVPRPAQQPRGRRGVGSTKEAAGRRATTVLGLCRTPWLLPATSCAARKIARQW